MEQVRDERQPVKALLGLWDAVAIIVGIVIGATIYKSPWLIMANVTTPGGGLAAWGLGGVLSFIGALCYAELASTYPRSGGDYVYLSRAFGDWCGFLFGWAQLAVILTASIGAMSFVFGDYATTLWQPPGTTLQADTSLTGAALETAKASTANAREVWIGVFAAAAVALLTLLNVLGVVLGKWTQNILSLVKVLGLVAIVVAGFRFGQKDVLQPLAAAPEKTSFGLAMIFVLYAFGGWNDAAFVAAEVRNKRNIVRALLIGTLLITAIYMAVNVAYLRVLGFEGMRRPSAVAAEVGRFVGGDRGAQAISVLVMISALGAINGLIFTGSRVYSTLGSDYSTFALLGRWSPRFGSPVWALLIQAAITLAMIGLVGTRAGRQAIDQALSSLGLPGKSGEIFAEGFDTLVSGTAPVFWTFFLLSGLSLFALRQQDRGIDRPFSVPLYPLVPIIFCAYCFYMLYSAIDYAKSFSLIGVVPLLVGLPLYYLSRRTRPESELPTS